MAFAAAAARSVFRSTSVRKAAAKLSSRNECLFGIVQPFHTVTASALMTSMLTLSQNGYGWLPEGNNNPIPIFIQNFVNYRLFLSNFLGFIDATLSVVYIAFFCVSSEAS
ncbi:hypothetical protein OSB04_013762 [Centaurea solstitialis]|uniref:Uncharacterized protein n=1 Tax=Centaurea solstitialis TaxID=347529 RepID=A0AA38TYL4_9ASTR|nr:hypothetical protein OSB04_013762 [Centaurea solstitialis]